MSRAAARARARARQEAAVRGEGRRQRADRWLVAAASLITLGLVASFWFITYVPGPMGWSVQVLLLCLVVAAGAGRALLGPSARAAEAGGISGARWQRALLGWPLVAVAAVLPYLHSLSVGFLSDDFGLYYGASRAGSALQALSTNPLPGFLRPLAVLLWWVGAKLWGGAPIGYHVMGVALHAANAVLVYMLGKRWIGSANGGLLAGLVFAVHPLHVEPVVWASCSADLLCTLFCLLALLGVETALTARATWGRAVGAAGAWAAFWLALMSKEAALALPGVVFLVVVLRQQERRWRRAVALTAPFALLLVGYLTWRFLSLGSLGGYAVRANLWNTVFPSAPLRHLAAFFFPMNRMLAAALHQAWLWYALAAAMVIGLHWFLRGLSYVPGRRLALWIGFVFVMAAPVWALPAATADLQHSRFAYLPTIGLAWLFGDLCAGRGAAWRRSGAMALATLLVAGALTVWYVTPWRAAHVKTEQVIASGADLLQQVERERPDAVLYVRGLPRTHYGAQVMSYGLPQAISMRLGRPAPVHLVAPSGDVPPEVFARSALLPGEYLAAWQEQSGGFAILRSGNRGSAPSLQGAGR